MFRTSKDYSYTDPETSPPRSSDRVIACNLCLDSEEYYSESELFDHKKECHRKLITELVHDPTANCCQNCIKTFPDQDALIRHIKTDHLFSSEEAQRVERAIFVCDVCMQIFFNKDLLTMHIKVLHVDKKNHHNLVTCIKCPKKIKRFNVWHHFQYHRIWSISCCPICVKKLPNLRELKTHVESHAHYYVCDMCNYETKHSDYFKRHLEKHKVADVTIESCREYWKYAAPMRKRWSYRPTVGIYGISKLNDLFVCILCRHICMDELDLARHISLHKTENRHVLLKKFYICTCGSVFDSGILLKHHVFKLKGEHQEALIS